jgi:hypothetical protein
MAILIGILVGVVVLGGAIILIVAGLRTSRSRENEDPLMARLEEATQRGDVISSLEEIEMQQPFNQRVIVPILRRVGEMSNAFCGIPLRSSKSQGIQVGLTPPLSLHRGSSSQLCLVEFYWRLVSFRPLNGPLPKHFLLLPYLR